MPAWDDPDYQPIGIFPFFSLPREIRIVSTTTLSGTTQVAQL